MSNILKQKIELEWEGKEYEMYFDMASIPVFKKVSGGKSFLQCSASLGQLDDENILTFMAATMRPKNDLKNPIGSKIHKLNILGLLMTHAGTVIDIVTSSMPQSSGGPTKKK